MKRRTWLGLMAAAGVTAAWPLRAQTWPARPVRLIVPFAPGGAADTLARRLGEHLGQRLGQPVLVENRPGGNTLIAAESVLRAPADGYTFYSTATAILQMPMLYPGRYDEARDFVAVAHYAATPVALAVPGDSPARDVAALVAHLRAKKDSAYGSTGVGGSQHLYGEVLKRSTGIDSAHVPYKGEAPLLSDFLGGRLDWYIATPISVLPHVHAGKARLLAVTGKTRVDSMPDVPTFSEAGVDGLHLVGWHGMFAAAGTPPDIIARMSAETVQVLDLPDIRAFLLESGLVPRPLDHTAFAAELPQFRTYFQNIIDSHQIRVD